MAQVEISNFLTPFTTGYTGFAVHTLDSEGYTLESLKDLKLALLTPAPLQAQFSSLSTRISELTTFTVSM